MKSGAKSHLEQLFKELCLNPPLKVKYFEKQTKGTKEVEQEKNAKR
jgi:hypothetical protein